MTPAVKRLVALANRLAEVLETENRLLAAARPAEMKALAPEKSELSLAYHEEMAALRADPGPIRAFGPAGVEAIKEVGLRLNYALDEQRRRLQAARTVAERILDAVVEEVDRRARPLHRYDATAALGRHAARARASGPAPAAIAFHEVV